jgi:hypothetical protein
VGEVHSSVADNFSVTRGGLLYRLARRLGAVSESGTHVIRAAIFTTLIAWVPLLILSSAQGLAYGPIVRIPFLRDIAANVRFLVALPILIVSATGVDRRWRLLVTEFIRSGLVRKSQLPSYEALLSRITRLRDSALPEVLIAIAAYIPSLYFANSEFLIRGVSNWHTVPTGVGTISWAGWWFKLVSEPLFRFLLLRWAWWMFLWVCFLRGVSRFDLFLVPTHTDKAAGLGFLSEGQKRFSAIVFAGGAVVAAQVANAIAYEGSTLSSMKWVLIAYAVLAVLFLVAPLLVVTPLLVKTKKKAIFDYGGLVTQHNQLFHSKWIESHAPPETLVGNPDPQSLANLGKTFAVVRDMSVVPVDKSTLITLGVAAALPMLPMVIFATPASELLKILLKMLG